MSETPLLLDELLEHMGFSGLWRSCSFDSLQDQGKKCFSLTERLIEASILV